MNTKKPKIAVLHDAFLYRWGGERLVTLMAKSLDADLISGFFSEGSFSPRELGFSGKMISLGKPVFKKGIRHLALMSRFRMRAKMLREYDIVIFSGNCLDAIRFMRKDAKAFYYCHTPPRYLFDFRDRYLEKLPKILRGTAGKILDIQAGQYIRLLGKMDFIFTNSRNTHDRLLHFCGKDSEILYPPTDTDRFVPHTVDSPFLEGIGVGDKEYYLSFSRLSPPKRVDMVVDAFLQMPDKNLVFTYGKNDPQKDMILEKCRNADNIFPIEAPNDEDFIQLVWWAVATIYIPIDEDFGMSPVESMSCGVPVIGVDEWWLKETILHGKTGFLLPKNIAVADIVSCVQGLSVDRAKAMEQDSLDRAKDFSLTAFVERLHILLEFGMNK